MSDKADPFDKEKQTIENLLSQWDEEEIPESELIYSKPRHEVPCFNTNVIEATSQIFEPVTAVPVTDDSVKPQEESVLVELGNQISIQVNDKNDGQLVLNEDMADLNEKILQNDNINVQNDIIMEEGHTSSHGVMKNGEFLPVEGGYIFVGGEEAPG